MYASAYEATLLRHANDDTRPPKPNVISLGIEAVGKDHYRHDWRGHWIWSMGRWNGPYKLGDFIREANVRLKAKGLPQIDVNPSWIA